MKLANLKVYFQYFILSIILLHILILFNHITVDFILLITLLIKSLIILIPILISVAFLTLLERKIMAGIQRRRGPNIVGLLGMLQPFADGLKLLLKETILPSRANKIIFLLAPVIAIFLSFLNWTILPFLKYSVYADINVGLLYVFSISSLGVYSILMSGWSSNSRYAFLGTLRATAQMISYEVSIGLIIINILLITNSLNLTQIVTQQAYLWFCFSLFPVFILFFISILAETNRPPFDLPEAEAELVAGYFVEYSAMGFAQFFLGENINIIFMCFLITILFLGGWSSWIFLSYFPMLIFIIKIWLVIFSFVWVRTTFPRYRYDQLMRLGWKIFLPISLSLVILNSSLFLIFNILI